MSSYLDQILSTMTQREIEEMQNLFGEVHELFADESFPPQEDVSQLEPIKPIIKEKPPVEEPRLILRLKRPKPFQGGIIIQHRGHRNNKTEMEFLVKKYATVPPIWYPWSKLRNQPILHHYLAKNKMCSIIPQKFKRKNQ